MDELEKGLGELERQHKIPNYTLLLKLGKFKIR